MKNVQAERYFLHLSLTVDQRGLGLWKDTIKPEMFTDAKLGKLYASIIESLNAGQPCDALAMTTKHMDSPELYRTVMDVSFDFAKGVVSSMFNPDYYAKTILDNYERRRTAEYCMSILQQIQQGGDILKLQEQLKDFESAFSQSEAKSLNGLKLDYAAELDQRGGLYKDVVGIPSGYQTLDMATTGFGDNWLVILAGRPAMGKTTFSLNLARNMVDFGHNGLYFSLEMSAKRLGINSIANEFGLNSQDVNKGKVQQGTVQAMLGRYMQDKKADLYIDDTAGASLTYILQMVRSYKAKYNIKFVMIDYLQLINHTGDNIRLKMTEIARRLKELAKELEIPIFVLSQLSRAVESRPGSRPIMSDIKESSGIEEAADAIGFIYRPEYYNITQDEAGNSLEGVTELILAKFRHGATRTFMFKFDKPKGRFNEIDGDFERSIDDYNMNLLEEQNINTALPPATNHFEDISFQEVPQMQLPAASDSDNPFTGLDTDLPF